MQLSVENERAVFVTEVSCYLAPVLPPALLLTMILQELNGSSTLWLLHLRPFASLNEFKSSPPSPVSPVRFV